MTKFVVVKEEPKDLPKGTYVVHYPDFMQEIADNKRREPRGGITAINHLRSIVGDIGKKYDPELGPYSIRPNFYEGRRYGSDAELSAIVVELLKDQYPAIFERYLNEKIKARPMNTRLVYYVGEFISTTPFYQNGLDKLEEKDVDSYLDLKPKKQSKSAATEE